MQGFLFSHFPFLAYGPTFTTGLNHRSRSAKAAAVDVKRTLRAGSNLTSMKKQRVDVRQADNAERDCHRKFIRMGVLFANSH